MNKTQQQELSELLNSLEFSAWSVGHHQACVRKYAAQADDWKLLGDAENLTRSIEWVISERKKEDQAKQDVADTKAKIMELCHE